MGVTQPIAVLQEVPYIQDLSRSPGFLARDFEELQKAMITTRGVGHAVIH